MPTNLASSYEQDGLLRVSLVTLVIVLTLFVALKAWNAASEHRYIGSAPVRDTISLDGNGKVTSQPTLAQESFGVDTQGADVAQVQAQNTEKINAVIAAVKGLGVADQDIQTSQYTLSSTYDYTNGKQRLTGYDLSQELTVKVRDLTKTGTVLAKVTDLGVNRVDGVSFSVDDPTLLQEQAREKAIQDAQHKADELTRVMGVHLGRIVGFTEDNGLMPRPLPMMDMAAAPGVAGSVAPAIQSGSLDTTSHVSVTFEIK